MIDDLQIARGLLLMIIALFLMSSFFMLVRNTEEMSGKVVEANESANNVLIEESGILDKDGQLVTGADVLNTVSKFQMNYSIIVKTQYSIKEYTKMNPFVKNMPCNLDYIEPEDYYLCRIYNDENTGDLTSIAFTLQGNYNTGEPIKEYSPNEDNASAYVMFTEDYEFTVPDGVDKIRLSACASGKGRLAGDYFGENPKEPVYIKVTQGDNRLTKIKVTIRYEGNTTIEFYNQKGELTPFNITGGSNTDPLKDLEPAQRKYPALARYVLGNRSSITLQPGVVNWAIPTYLFTEFYSGVNGTDSGVFTNQIVGDGAYVSGEKGLGGFGGAFGFGGGGGAPALAVYGVNEEASVTHYIKRALGGTSGGAVVSRPTIVAEGGVGTDGLNIFAKIFGDTNQTEVLNSSDLEKYRAIIKGGTGGNGTMVSAGNGGTVTYPTEPDLNINAYNNALGLSIQTALDNPFYVIGASGGGAAGGYGAGGGTGGGGIMERIYYIQEGNKFTISTTAIGSVYESTDIVVQNGNDGMPSCGMVYIRCESE